MGAFLKKSLAVSLSGCLVLGALPARALASEVYVPQVTAAAPTEDPKAAMDLFERAGVFKGPDDPLRSYVGGRDGKPLTALGEVMYRYLRAQANPAEYVDGFKDGLENLRKSGDFSPKKAEAMQSAFERYHAKFGALPPPTGGDVTDTFRYGTLTEAYMTGAAVADPPKKGMTQHELPDGSGWEFYDDQGLAFRLNKNQVTTYNRELQKQQRELNRTRPPGTKFIPETGRYNVEMLELSQFRLKQQVDELERAYRMDRMINMAELLGKQYKEDMWFKDLSLEADLEKWAREKKFTHNGKTYSVYEIVQAKVANRKLYLEQAREGVARFAADVDKLRGADTITDQKLASMTASEQFVLRHLSLVFLESQKFYVKNQLERLDPRSPDSQMLHDAIKDSHLNDDARRRLKQQGAMLEKRLKRLQTIFGTVQDALAKSDYASSLDMVQAALNSSQKELQEIGLDYTLFTEAPTSTVLAKTQTGTALPSFNGTADPRKWTWGFTKWAVEKTNLGGHGDRMKQVRQALPQYDKLVDLVADGKYHEARQVVIAMNPTAGLRRMELGMSGGTSPKVTDQLRVTGSLREARELLASVQKVNKWADAAGNFMTWSLSMGFGGPVIAGSLSLAARPFRAMAGQNNRFLPHLVAETLEHAATRVRSLNPAPENLSATSWLGRYLQAGVYRSGSFAMRQTSFTLLAGVISGGFTTITHVADGLPFKANLGIGKIGEGHSLYAGWTDAFAEGFVGGVQWSNEGIAPMLGYVGLPSSAFEGTWAAKLTETIASRGLVGGARTLVNRGVGKLGIDISERWTLDALSKRGLVGYGSSLGLGIIDNIAKYHAFTMVIGKGAEWATYHGFAKDERDIERRIKRSIKAGLSVMESPAWMLLPVFPAKYEEMAAGHQRSLQGAEEYLKSPDPSKRAMLYNAADDAMLPMLSKAKMPAMQILFNYTIKGGRPSEHMFQVTKEIKRKAIADELMSSLPGGGKHAKLADINPLEFLKVSELDADVTPQIGNNLHVTDDVRFVARQKFAEGLHANLRLTEEVLSAKPGAKVAGFGTVTPKVQREVAVQMHVDQSLGKKVPPGIASKASALLERYLKADNMKGPAESLLKAIRARSDSGPAAEKFEMVVKKMLEDVGDWKRRVDAGETKEGYMSVLKRLQSAADDLHKKGELTAQQHEALRRWFEYVEAGEARFQSFNNVEMTHTLVSEELAALKEQYGGSAGMRSLLDQFEQKIKTWRGGYADGKARVEAPGEVRFSSLMSELQNMADAALSARSISPVEAQALKASLKEMKASPWILHDSKGTALAGWRPGQFESLMEALGLAVLQGQGGAPIREFIRLTTGGGKTLLTFEGLLPLAEADAAVHGMKVSFLTVQSNLEAQARLEFMSLKKIGSKLEFDTYEGFKSQIAEAKSKGETFIEKHWILGDEMDGAALQPALTLGETTGKITRLNSVYHRINEINDFMSGMLGKGAKELAEQIKMHSRRAQSVLDTLPPGAPEAPRARQATEKLLRAADNLGSARTPEARLKAQQSLSSALGELRAATISEPLPTAALETLHGGVKRLNDLADSGAAPAQIRAALFEQLQSISGVRTQQGNALRRNIEKALHEVKVAQTPSQAGKAAKEAATAQRGLLAESSIAGEVKASLELAMSKVSQLLDGAKRLEGVKERRLRLETELQQVKTELKADRKNESLKTRRKELETELDAARAVEAEFAAGLVHQQNLLGVVKGDAKGRMDAVRAEARKIADEVQTRIERLEKRTNRTPELEAELALARRELALAERFMDGSLARAQKLLEKVAELKEGGAPAKLAQAEKELAAVRERLDGAETKLLSRYESELTKLKDAVQRNSADDIAAARREIKTLRDQAVQRRADIHDLHEVRRHFRESGEELLQLVQKGDAAAEGEAAILLKRRHELLEAFAGEENGAYKVFRKMKEQAYSFARNMVLEDGPAIQARARDNSLKLIHEHVNAMKSELKQVESAPAGELRTKTEALLKEHIAAWEKLPREGDVMGPALNLSIKQIGERNAISKQLRRQRSGLDAAYASALETSLTGLARRDAVLGERLQKEAETVKTAAESNVIEQMSRRIDGNYVYLGTPKLLWNALTNGKIEAPVHKAGLTRLFAAELLKEIIRNPVMPAGVRDQMIWEVVPSLLFPRGIRNKGSSYVREEFINMIRGYYDNPATIRVDNITGAINVIHNGQWFETMDNPTRRFWEIHYGTDLTLKYTHKSLSTIKDLTSNRKARFISLSATAGEKYKAHLIESEVVVGGQGAKSPTTVDLVVHHGEGSKMTSVSQALKRVMEESKKRVAFRPSELLDANSGAPKSVRDYLESTGIAKKDATAMDLEAIPAGEVRDYFAKLRNMQGENTGLVVLSLSDTVMLKKIRNYLIKTGAVKEHEIAQVFSDAEWLRLNRPEARVRQQMNLNGMPDGKVKILLLDTRVGGRGLDLDYKGQRGNTKPEGFKGYTNYEMLVIDPHEMSAVHLLQAQGRIDLGRVLPGARRRFELVLDVNTVQKEHHFKEMVSDSPFFTALRNDASIAEFARREGMRLNKKVDVDWALIDAYVKNFERQRTTDLALDPAVQAFARERGRPVDAKLVREYLAQADDAARKKHGLVERYEAEVTEWLKKKQQNVEEDQLRSSSVLQDRPIIDHRLRWLDMLAR